VIRKRDIETSRPVKISDRVGYDLEPTTAKRHL